MSSTATKKATSSDTTSTALTSSLPVVDVDPPMQQIDNNKSIISDGGSNNHFLSRPNSGGLVSPSAFLPSTNSEMSGTTTGLGSNTTSSSGSGPDELPSFSARLKEENEETSIISVKNLRRDGGKGLLSPVAAAGLRYGPGSEPNIEHAGHHQRPTTTLSSSGVGDFKENPKCISKEEIQHLMSQMGLNQQKCPTQQPLQQVPKKKYSHPMMLPSSTSSSIGNNNSPPRTPRISPRKKISLPGLKLPVPVIYNECPVDPDDVTKSLESAVRKMSRGNSPALMGCNSATIPIANSGTSSSGGGGSTSCGSGGTTATTTTTGGTNSSETFSGLTGLAKGYEQYRESLSMLHIPSEYGEPSSDDLSSEWESSSESSSSASGGSGTSDQSSCYSGVVLKESVTSTLIDNYRRRKLMMSQQWQHQSASLGHPIRDIVSPGHNLKRDTSSSGSSSGISTASTEEGSGSGSSAETVTENAGPIFIPDIRSSSDHRQIKAAHPRVFINNNSIMGTSKLSGKHSTKKNDVDDDDDDDEDETPKLAVKRVSDEFSVVWVKKISFKNYQILCQKKSRYVRPTYYK